MLTSWSKEIIYTISIRYRMCKQDSYDLAVRLIFDDYIRRSDRIENERRAEGSDGSFCEKGSLSLICLFVCFFCCDVILVRTFGTENVQKAFAGDSSTLLKVGESTAQRELSELIAL